MSMSSHSHWTHRQALSLLSGFAGIALHACTQQTGTTNTSSDASTQAQHHTK